MIEMESQKALELFTTDPEIKNLAIELVSKWDDPYKKTFNTFLWQDCINASINQTCHDMGIKLASTPEFRELMIENMKKLLK